MLPVVVWLILVWLIRGIAADIDDEAYDQLPYLRPLHIDDFESASGYSKRDAASDFDFLNPSDLAQLAMGAPTGVADNEFMLANMTLHAPNNTLLVAMERFEGLTKAVDCMGDDGELSLTFKTKEAFETAQEKWHYINDDDDANFLLITNHDGCGPGDERQIYRITKVDNDESSFKTLMEAEPLEFGDIADTFEVDWGRIEFTEKGRRQIRVRGFDLPSMAGHNWDALKDPTGTATPTTDVDLERRFEKSWNYASGVPVNIGPLTAAVFHDFTKFPPRLHIDCVGCVIESSWRFDGHFALKWFRPVSFLTTAMVENLKAHFNFRTKVVIEKDYHVDKTKDITWGEEWGMTHEEYLISQAIPGVGFSFMKVFAVGFFVSLSIRHEIQTFGRFEFDWGVTVDVPSGAKISVDLIDPQNNEFVGFGDATYDGHLEPRNGNGEINFLAYPAPAIEFGIRTEKWPNLPRAQLIMRCPSVHANVSLGWDSEGYCEKGSQYQFGGKVTGRMGFELWGRVPRMDFVENWDTFFTGLQKKNFFQYRFWKGPALMNWHDCWPIKIYEPVDPPLDPPPGWSPYPPPPGEEPRPPPPDNEQPPPSPPDNPQPPPPDNEQPPPPGDSPHTCKVIADALRYRTCPHSSDDCPALGQFSAGHMVKFKCWVKGDYVDSETQPGSDAWGKDFEGRFFALAYIDGHCATKIPACAN